MIKKIFKSIFGKRKIADNTQVAEKPHPSSPESSKSKTPEAKRSEPKKEAPQQKRHHHDNKPAEQTRQPEKAAQPESRQRPDNKKHNNRNNSDRRQGGRQQSHNNKKPDHQRQERPTYNTTPVKVEPAKPETDWEPAEIPTVEDGCSFYGLGLENPIVHGIADLGFVKCTDIQATTLPEALKGRDIAGKAQTGTGKTAAFLIAAFDYFLKNPLTETYSGTPRCLIIAPTRELAVQIGKDAKELGKYCGANVLSVFGGMDYEKQATELGDRVDILVATPGRLIDYARRKIVHLNKVEILVIDEADRMLDMGFIPDVRRIIGHLPGSNKRVTQIYSATLSKPVMTLATTWMKKDYHVVEIDPDTVVSEDVEQVVYMVTAKQKVPIILWHLKHEEIKRMMIFTNRKDESAALADALFEHGIDLELLTGDVPQRKRMSILERFRSGELKVVVATDVAGRGIHVDDVSHVINFELPYEPEDYVHRVGRTGRAGAKGRAISFACENSAFELPTIEEYIGNALKCTTPEEFMVEEHEKVREAPKRKPQSNNRRNSGGSGGGNRGNSRGSRNQGSRNSNYRGGGKR